MTSAGANNWSVLLEINNLEAQINKTSGNVTNPLTANLLGANFNIQGLSAPPTGTPFVVLSGGQEFLIETSDLTPQISVDGTGVHLGTSGSGYTVTAPTIANPADNTDKVATCAFVQSAVSAGSSNVNSVSTSLSGLTVSPTTGNVVISGTLGASSGGTGVVASSGANSVALRDALQNIDAVSFTGALVGNASSATTATNATNATNIQVTSTNANATHYLSFVDTSSTGLKSLQTDTNIRCNPALNSITATTFNGALNGNANSANSAGTATLATTATNLDGGDIGNISFQVNPNNTDFLPNGVAGTVLTSNGVGAFPSWETPTPIPVTVSSFSAGSTGLTPNTATTGAVVLSGTLAVANGGTGVTSSTGANSVVLRDGSQNVSAVTFTGALVGNASTATTATSAGKATNIAGGLGGSIPYQTAVDTTALLANGTAGQVLTSQGTTLAPTWTTLTPASTPTLSAVLTAGNTATNSITLNNTGVGANTIKLLPNNGATDPHIEISDGTTTNTIDKNGYTTRNSVQNATHYLNFSDSSSTGTGAIQKTAGISCNPSTNTITATTLQGAYVATGITSLGGFDVTNGAQITATTFQGALSGNASTATLATTATNIAGGVIGNIPYQAGAGSTSLLTNGASGTVLTSGGVGGIPTWTTPSTTATTVSVTDTNTGGTYYPTFVSSGGSGQTLRADVSTTPFTYNPNTGLLTTTTFAGALTGLASQASAVTITDTNTNATYYPVFTDNSGTNKTLNIDKTTSVLAYNPNSGTLVGTILQATQAMVPTAISDIYSSGGSSGQVLTAGTGGQVVWGSANNSANFGSGGDGAVSLDVSVASGLYQFVTWDGVLTYTLTRDVYATTFTMTSNVVLLTAGYRVFATIAITLDTGAYMANNGSNGVGTVGGAGGLGGYFRAGGTGATGLLAASAGAVGTAPTVPTGTTWVGMLGGRGASGRATTTTFAGSSPMTVANFNLSVPANADGGRSILYNINFWNQRSLSTASALWFPTGSLGGASGSKSTLGTTATSGSGGGAGGFIFLASPTITGDIGCIRAIGGNGGNGAGTGGNFGGGGSGAGGLIGVLTGKSSYNSALFNVSAGVGGSSIGLGTNSPVCISYGTGSSLTTNPLIIYPTNALSQYTIYIVSLAIQGSAGLVASAVSLTGAGCEWYEIGNQPFNGTFPLEARRLQVFIGRKDSGIGYNVPYSDDPRLVIIFDVAPTSVRYTYDAIFNTSESEDTFPLIQSISTVAVNTTTITSTLLSSPFTATTMMYSVVARSGGTVPVGGTGNTLVSQGVTPALASQVSINRQSNTQTWTTNADSAIATFEFNIPSVYETGSVGESGKVVPFLV